MKGLTWKLGLVTSLAGLTLLAPFCAGDRCLDRGGAVDDSGTQCQFAAGQIEPLGTWSWPIQAWVYFLVLGSIPGLAIGAIASRARRHGSGQRTADAQSLDA
jgi:hypothetical protein